MEDSVRPWYDTKEGIAARLKGDLPGLREVALARHQAAYDRKERLQDWCILGMFWTDSCGNFALIERGAPADGVLFWKMEGVYKTPPVMDREETAQFASRWTAVMGSCLPPEGARCDRCGGGWTLGNIRDYYLGRHEKARPRHKRCQELWVIEEEQKEFRTILERAEIPYTEMIMIPNGYHQKPFSTYFGPWFMVETPKGRIKIGWRKRVISINWSQSALSAKGADVVENPDVTYGPEWAHAWGIEKAVETLRTLWRLG